MSLQRTRVCTDNAVASWRKTVVRYLNFSIASLKQYGYNVGIRNCISLTQLKKVLCRAAPSSISAEYQQIILDWIKAEPLNAEQIRTKLHEQYALDIKATNIRRFLNLSGIVYKRTRHSLKKKKPDWIWTSSARFGYSRHILK